MNQKKMRQLMNELQELQMKSMSSSFRKELSLIQKETLRLERAGQLTPRNLRKFITDNKISMSKFNLSTYDSFILGDIRAFQSGARSPAIGALLRAYKNPRTLALKIHKFSLLKLQGSDGSSLKGVEKNIYSQISVHFDKNAKQLAKIVKDFQKDIAKVNRIITTNKSKQIFNYRKKLQRMRVNGKPLSATQVEKEMYKKFRNVKTSDIARIVDTESHAQQELVSTTRAIQNGFKWKVWNNRPNAGKGGDVRDTHKALNKKKVRIGKTFNVRGQRAMFPSDPSLSAGERINCRCVLTFEK